MTSIFDLLYSVNVRLSKLFKKGKITEAQWEKLSNKLALITSELETIFMENGDATDS